MIITMHPPPIGGCNIITEPLLYFCYQNVWSNGAVRTSAFRRRLCEPLRPGWWPRCFESSAPASVYKYLASRPWDIFSRGWQVLSCHPEVGQGDQDQDRDNYKVFPCGVIGTCMRKYRQILSWEEINRYLVLFAFCNCTGLDRGLTKLYR